MTVKETESEESHKDSRAHAAWSCTSPAHSYEHHQGHSPESLVDTSWSSPKPQARNSVSLPISYIKLQFPRDPHDLFSELLGNPHDLFSEMLGQQLLFGACSFSLAGRWP